VISSRIKPLSECEHKASFPDTFTDMTSIEEFLNLCGSFWDFKSELGKCSLTCTPDKYKNQNVTEMQFPFSRVLSFFQTFSDFRFQNLSYKIAFFVISVLRIIFSVNHIQQNDILNY